MGPGRERGRIDPVHPYTRKDLTHDSRGPPHSYPSILVLPGPHQWYALIGRDRSVSSSPLFRYEKWVHCTGKSTYSSDDQHPKVYTYQNRVLGLRTCRLSRLGVPNPGHSSDPGIHRTLGIPGPTVVPWSDLGSCGVNGPPAYDLSCPSTTTVTQGDRGPPSDDPSGRRPGSTHATSGSSATGRPSKTLRPGRSRGG